MEDFAASINRKRLLINMAGYAVIFLLYVNGPPMGGFIGGVIRTYLIVFPAFYLLFLYLRYKAEKGGRS